MFVLFFGGCLFLFVCLFCFVLVWVFVLFVCCVVLVVMVVVVGGGRLNFSRFRTVDICEISKHMRFFNIEA